MHTHGDTSRCISQHEALWTKKDLACPSTSLGCLASLLVMAQNARSSSPASLPHHNSTTPCKNEKADTGAVQLTARSLQTPSNTSSFGCSSVTFIVTGLRLAGSREDEVEPFTSPSPSPRHKTTKHLYLPTSKPCNPQPNQTQKHTPPKNATTKPSLPPLLPSPLPHALPTPTPTTTTPQPASNPIDPEHNARASALPAKPLSHTTTHLHPVAARVRLTDPPRTGPHAEPREPPTAPHTAQQTSPTPAGTGASPNHASTPPFRFSRLSTGSLHPLDRARGHARVD